jgi:hypothetical protein
VNGVQRAESAEPLSSILITHYSVALPQSMSSDPPPAGFNSFPTREAARPLLFDLIRRNGETGTICALCASFPMFPRHPASPWRQATFGAIASTAPARVFMLTRANCSALDAGRRFGAPAGGARH